MSPNQFGEGGVPDIRPGNAAVGPSTEQGQEDVGQEERVDEAKRRPKRYRAPLTALGVGVVSLLIVGLIFSSPGEAAINDFMDHAFGKDKAPEKVELSPPALFEPQDGTVMGTSSPTLTWVPVDHADSYNVLVSPTADFKDGYTLFSDTSSIYVNHDLYDTIYYWKVRAINGTDNGPWSEVGTFRVDAHLIPPTLSFPNDTAGIANKTPYLEWLPSADATLYRVQLAADPNFTKLVVDLQITTVNYRPNVGLQSGATYYWRVMALGNDALSDWSPYRSFSV